jgi:two-component system phosphate regulon response regulator PhoB
VAQPKGLVYLWINLVERDGGGMALQGKRIFAVEDEADIAELVRYNLTLEGFHVETFGSGEEGLQAVENQPPSLLLLDLMLPGMSGLEICRVLRSQEKTRNLPIIIVSAKGEEEDVVRGLELGADDYITKPFSPKVLASRITAVLRRSENRNQPLGEADIVEFPGIMIHPGRHEVVVGAPPEKSEKVSLTHSEFQILHFLARRPGWVFTRSQIVDAVHGENYAVTDRSIDFQMVGLRKKLGDMGQHIETVRGVGYRFKELN